MAGPPQNPTRFDPLQRPGARQRRVALLLAPIVWVVALVTVAVVVGRSDVVGIALALFALVMLAGLAFSLSTRLARLRREGRR